MRGWTGLGICLLMAGCVHLPIESITYLQTSTLPVTYEYIGYGTEKNPLPLGFQFRLFGGGVLITTPDAAKALEHPDGNVPKSLLSHMAMIKYNETRGWIAGSLARLPDGSRQTLQQLLFSNRWDLLFPRLTEEGNAKTLPSWIRPNASPPSVLGPLQEGEALVGFQPTQMISARNQPASLWLRHQPGDTAQTCLVMVSSEQTQSEAEESAGFQKQCRSVRYRAFSE